MGKWRLEWDFRSKAGKKFENFINQLFKEILKSN